MMLLAIDIGNTNITIGIWDGDSWRKKWRLQTESGRTVDEFGIMITSLLSEPERPITIDAVILSSVVPILTRTFETLCNNYLNLAPLIINSNLDTGIRIFTDYPSEVGADRIANAVGAYFEYKSPCIVLDMGTASKFDVITGSGEFLGGVIAPGLELIADALVSRAAKLSQVPLTAPPKAIGKNTIEAMQSGLVFGSVCMIEGMVNRLKAEHPNQPDNILVIGTGGLIDLVSPYTEIFDHLDQNLTLTGLRHIFERLHS